MRYFASALLTILFAAALSDAALAYTWTYTFQFNVNATNIPSGGTLAVQCQLKDQSGNLMPAIVSTSGSGPLTNSGSTLSYSGPINVTVSYSSPDTSKVPGAYLCMLLVHSAGVPIYNGTALNVNMPMTQANSGWTGTMWASGTLP
jgi:hypothetical protein